MKIAEKIKRLFQREPPTPEQLAAATEGERELERIRTQYATEQNPTQLTPP